MQRRTFLAGASAALGCRAPSGSFVEDLPFLDEGPRELESTYGTGLDGRRVLDLATLTADDLVLPQHRLFLRTAEPQGLGDDWQVRLRGLVGRPVDLDVELLRAQARDMGPVHFECSGNSSFGGFGLQGAVAFGGVPWAWVLEQVEPDPAATAVRVTGLDDHPPPTGTSTPGASWVFPLDELQEAFLATHIDGEPLTRDHGWPVRWMMPGWYGCCCIKWVTEIAWVDDSEPATSQMMEFAGRTHQNGVPDLARDYAPAEIDVAAVPIRARAIDVGGTRRVWVEGLVWGGARLPSGLRLWAGEVDAGLVEVYPERASPRTWGLWHALLPEGLSGPTELTLTVDDPEVRTRRLDEAYYMRTIVI